VKLLAKDDELYVLAQSHDRVNKERAMRRRQLKRLWARLGQLSTMKLTREDLLMKLGAGRGRATIHRGRRRSPLTVNRQLTTRICDRPKEFYNS
jgi:hypothetical protein